MIMKNILRIISNWKVTMVMKLLKGTLPSEGFEGRNLQRFISYSPTTQYIHIHYINFVFIDDRL